MRSLRNDRCSSNADPPKSQNMNPTASSTAAGSRITVYLPGGKSCGFTESMAFCAAISASLTASSCAASVALSFCQPEEVSPIMVIEASPSVCSYQSATPCELKMPSHASADEKIPAAVSECFLATSTICDTTA